VPPILMSDKFESPTDIALDASGKNILVPDRKAGSLAALPISIPGWEVDDSPLAIRTEPALENVEWAGWDPDSGDGRIATFRPILLTHAGDGSNRVFVPTQEGVVHVLSGQEATKSSIFLDLSSRVRYTEKQYEEGFLGLAFHPKFESNGEFFVFYTDVDARLTNVVSRFRVSKDDSNRADPTSEEVLIRFKKPYWNHDGGTILFGPDGYLYVAHGDGGAANDPHDNGQNLNSILGKVLRLDVDGKEGERNYAIPKDNPFVRQRGARPEVWAYGLRNVWRMSFDRQTGRLWAADVGQNLYEEIDILEAGGNFGWNRREGLHPFGRKGVDAQKDPIDPIWEYRHDIGKSMTGGVVYRGQRLPELDGAYLYGDYVSSRIWALWFDESKGRVVANREIQGPGLPLPTFGEDEAGEPYVLVHSASGKGIFRFTRSAEAE
jgi:glucose/arabinose dehydrogenase